MSKSPFPESQQSIYCSSRTRSVFFFCNPQQLFCQWKLRMSFEIIGTEICFNPFEILLNV